MKCVLNFMRDLEELRKYTDFFEIKNLVYDYFDGELYIFIDGKPTNALNADLKGKGEKYFKGFMESTLNGKKIRFFQDVYVVWDKENKMTTDFYPGVSTGFLFEGDEGYNTL